MEFETAVYVTAINIYETWNGGGVKMISARTPDGSWKAIWETLSVEVFESARIFSPSIQVFFNFFWYG